MESNNTQSRQASNNLERYGVIHVATNCDEHGVHVTQDLFVRIFNNEV
jgi:hypothetical protein